MSQRYTTILLCILLIGGLASLLPLSARAQQGTILQAGDIVFTGVNTTDNDEFTFAPLVDLAAGTQIFFTDNGWQANGSFRATEGVVVYTAPSLIARGTLIRFLNVPSQPVPNFSADSRFLLAADGDQVIAYQGSAATPAFISALTTKAWAVEATTSNNSVLPRGLVTGTSAVVVPRNNAFMSQVGQRKGPVNSLRTWFATASSWTGIGTSATRQDWMANTSFNQALQVEDGVVPDADELLALQSLFTSTNGTAWSIRTNWPTTATPWPTTLTCADFATWFGISVSNGDVTAVQLPNNHLEGTLPVELGKLTQLTTLALPNNQLHEAVPQEWSQLTKLQNLYLEANQLSGAFPNAFTYYTELRILSLWSNQFSGPLPRIGLRRWSHLTELRVHANRLTGELPGEVGLLPQLQTLVISGNQFRGGLPDSLRLATQLSFVNLAYNQFTGSIPASWQQISQLGYLYLNNNHLSGGIPAGIASLPPLSVVNVAHNQLSGTIPLFAGAGGRLGIFAFEDNRFTGLASYLGIATPFAIQLSVSQNQLDFTALESNLTGSNDQHPFGLFLYDAQSPSTPADTVTYLQNATLSLSRQPTGQYNNFMQWQREVGGMWTDIPGATSLQWVKTNAGEADRGLYRMATTNGWATNMTVYTRAIYADLVPYERLLANRPVDGNTPALQTALAPTSRGSATDTVNYVRVFTARAAYTNPNRLVQAVVDSVQVSTQYVDGLGRPLQRVLRQETPGRRDLIQPMSYDALGHQSRQYLPYAAANPGGTLGEYRADALYTQYHFYLDNLTGPGAPTDGLARTGVPFAETVFESSPLERPLVQAAPGESWQMATNHVVSRLERANTSADSVQYFVPGTGANANDLMAQANGYPNGALWGTQTTDEHGYRTIEWKDELGQTVLKQVEINRLKRVSGGLTSWVSRWLRTYYVYDDYGHLRAMLPPEAVKALQANSWAMTPAAEKLLFRYRYDGQGAVVTKQVPGTDGETWFVYDQLGRPVLSQDAGQRGRNEWSYTKYDGLGRPILTGLVNRTATLATLQAEAAAALSTAEQLSANINSYPHGYTTDQAYPSLGQQGFGAGEVLTVTYYDDYNFDNDAQDTPEAAYDTQLDAQLAVAPRPDSRVTGLVTRTKTRVLGLAATAPNAWVTTTTFYDERARPVQVQGTNARGGQDVVTSQLDFAGKAMKSVALHHGPSLPTAGLQVAETMQYDHAGRLLATRQQLPGEAQLVPIASMTYNELGQLMRKTIGTGGLTQNVDYRYNVRGWLTHLNDSALQEPSDLFGLELCYENSFTAGYEQYNGNLTGQKWRSKYDQTERAYGYIYDHVNRLLQGDYVARAATTITAPWTAEVDNYRLYGMSYDDNGNILSLRRRGLLANATRTAAKQYGLVDLLTYRYEGNRLQAVDDEVTTNQLPRPIGYHGAPTSLAGDFQEQGVRQTQEYFYDTNGSLIQDRNKGITNIVYNHLHLPRQIHFGTGADSLVFHYTATGQKVAKLVYQTGRSVRRTDYLNQYQYEQDSLRFFPHAEGRVLRFTSTTSGAARYQREFAFKDHLGNLRLAYRAGRRLTYVAGMEPSDAARETQQFDSLSVSAPVAQAVGGLARTRQYVAKLNAGGAAPQPLGPLKQLAVQKGDTITVTAPGYYPQAVQGSSFAFSLASFVAGLMQQHPAPPVRLDGGGRTQGLPLLSIGVSAGLPTLLQTSNGVPKGYVRLLVFDADSNLVSSQTQTRQLSSAAHTGYEQLTAQVIVQQNGYVTVYVGNESNADVYFDDVTIQYRQGLQIQETQYDPWGLNLAGLSRTSPGLDVLNQYKFNDKEFQADLGLNWSHYGARFYDAQLGKWGVVDPKTDNYADTSPYAYCLNNPLRYIDPTGKEVENDGREQVGITASAKKGSLNLNYTRLQQTTNNGVTTTTRVTTSTRISSDPRAKTERGVVTTSVTTTKDGKSTTTTAQATREQSKENLAPLEKLTKSLETFRDKSDGPNYVEDTFSKGAKDMSKVISLAGLPAGAAGKELAVPLAEWLGAKGGLLSAAVAQTLGVPKEAGELMNKGGEMLLDAKQKPVILYYQDSSNGQSLNTDPYYQDVSPQFVKDALQSLYDHTFGMFH